MSELNKIKILDNLKKDNIDHLVYCPLVYNNELIKDGIKRKYINQSRLHLLSNQISKNTTVLDLGTNSGYILKELARLNNIKGVGVDVNQKFVNLCQLLNQSEHYELEFICMDVQDYIKFCLRYNIKFDYIMFLSVFDYSRTMSMVDDLLMITNYKLFLEPTNHSKRSKDYLFNFRFKPYIDKYNWELLGYTDYQNRLLLMIEK